MHSLLFDLRAVQPSPHGHHGGAEYTRAVFQRAAALPGDLRIRAFYDLARPLAADILESAAAGDVELIGLEKLSDLQRVIDEPDVYRFYSSLPYAYRELDMRDKDVVLTIHGLRPVELPTDRYAWRYAQSPPELLSKCLQRAFQERFRRFKYDQLARVLRPRGRRRLLVVPSLHTKYAILAQYPWIADNDVCVYYSPRTAVCARSDTDPGLLHERGLAPREYLLLVSSNRWIKNSYRTFQALEEFQHRFPQLQPGKVVAVGGAPARAPKRWRQRFLFLSDLSARELATLYRHAFVLVYPSLNEGFGYPPVEAMSYGTPSISSAVTSIPEVCGNGTLYVSPYARHEIQNRLLWLIRDEHAWELASERARARYEIVSKAQDEMLDQLCQRLVTADDPE